MTNPDRNAEAIGIVVRLRDERFTDDELGELLNRLTELFGEHDINLPHVPQDAGEYRAAIIEVLVRIPDGWGRWISCDAGWYPLIAELNRELAVLDPNYVVHQIKEKYGVLRFYAETGLEGELGERFDELIADAEERSAATCEWCGGPAERRPRSKQFTILKTLCNGCSDASP